MDTPKLTNPPQTQLIKAGDGVIMANSSGNRDEDIFPSPDDFDMHRPRGAEAALGYGFGAHRCVAEWLARAEMEEVFVALVTRVPGLRVARLVDRVDGVRVRLVVVVRLLYRADYRLAPRTTVRQNGITNQM